MMEERRWRSRCIGSAREIHEILKKGKEIKTRWYRLVFLKSDREAGRFAVLAPKKLGKATERNRIKRRMREILRGDTVLEASSIDMVIIPKICVRHEDIRVLADAFHKTMMDIQR